MILRDALRRLTLRTFLLAFLGNAMLLLLGWAWLFIPDSHTWQFLFSLVLAAVLLAGFFALHATLVRRLHSPVEGPLWRAVLVLAGWLLLGFTLQHVTGLLSVNVGARAGYWNSQLSAQHRAFWTYARLVHCQDVAIELLTWIVVPALLLPFTVQTVARPALRNPVLWRTALTALRRWPLWLTTAFAYLAGSWFADRLLAWHPGHTTAVELFSLVLRTGIVSLFAMGLLLFTLAVVAELLTRASLQHSPRRDAIP